MYDTSVQSTSAAYGSNYLSLMSGRDQHQQSFNDTYTALILEETQSNIYNTCCYGCNTVSSNASLVISHSSPS